MISGTVEQCCRAENALKALAICHNFGDAPKAKMVLHGTLVFDVTEEALEEDLRAFMVRNRLF